MRMIEFTQARPTARSLAVGTFDGVHVGHRSVIGSADTVLTFEPHPVSVIAPAHLPRLLTPLAVKADLIASGEVSRADPARGDDLAVELAQRHDARREAPILGEQRRIALGAGTEAEVLADGDLVRAEGLDEHAVDELARRQPRERGVEAHDDQLLDAQ